MSRDLEVAELAEQDFAGWEQFVAKSPDGSAYALPGYLDALASAAGGRFRILVARRGGEIAGGLPLYEPAGRGRTAGPRLLLYYLSPVLRRWETTYPSQRTAREVEVLGALAAALDARGYDRVTLKWQPTLLDARPFLARGWTVRPSYTYVAPLADLGALRSRMEQNLRRLVDRCDRAGLTLSEDDDPTAFFRLHTEALARQGQAPYLPSARFAPFLQRLRAGGLGRLFFARMPDGTPGAMQLVLTGPCAVTHTVCAGADLEPQRLGASAFLRWRVFEALAAAGHSANDLTDAALNRVTHFKSQLGADLALCHVVQSPPSLRWRVAEAGAGLLRRGRGLAASLRRRPEAEPE